MEPMQNKFLSRLDIINILKKRHLNIPCIEKLTYEELLRIFKRFAVPLEKRIERFRNIPAELEVDTNVTTVEFDCEISPPCQTVEEAQQIIAENQIFQQQMPHILQQAKYLKLSFNTISNQAPKRYSMYGEEVMEGPTPAKRFVLHH